MSDFEQLLVELAIVVIASGLLAWLALVARQPMIVAYIVCGALLGPWGLHWIRNPSLIRAISDLGIVLLLFLAGVVLHPERLLRLFRRTAPVTLANCAGSFVAAFAVALACGFGPADASFIAAACMFASTIVVVKLLPTTTLHQEHMGALAVGVLIFQDLMAVAVLVVMRGVHGATAGAYGLPRLLIESAHWPGISVSLVLVGAPVVLIVLALLLEQFALRRMMRRIDQFDEGIYLLALGWCLGNAMLWKWCGLSQEVGAFVAGVALARSPVSLFISEGLKPLRDFFLVLFFFVLGTHLDWSVGWGVLLPAAAVAGVLMLLKPLLFNRLFRWTGEEPRLSWEISVRLGQLSEFGLIIAVLGHELGQISHRAAQLIDFAVILSIAVSSYVVVFRYPTPIGPRRALHRD